MADAGQFAQDADILLRLPTGASATVKAAGYFDKIVIDVEGLINCACLFDFSAADAATSITATVRGIIVETAACLCAIEGIIFDMAGANRIEMEDVINVLRDRYLFNLAILRDKKTQKFIIDPTTGSV